MKTTTCTVRFVCPAFLGDARQQAAWRTPPFKAELRHWWRVLLAGQGHAYDAIRQREANLFGNAWPDQIASKSRVRLRLSRWEAGRLVNPAPRVGQIANGKNQVDGGLYLGYGAIGYDKSTKDTRLEHEPAIDAGEAAELRIGVRPCHDPAADNASEITDALALMGRYGTIGGRSRNAWGSFVLESDDLAAADTSAALLDWREALAHEWPRGIGQDKNGPLIWRSPAEKNWQKVMYTLAQLRSDLNRSFGSIDDRALLSSPVKRKNVVPTWGDKVRLPNSLRFKIVPDGERVRGLVFHMPCRPNDDLWRRHPNNNAAALASLWQSVHQKLDAQLQRVNA